jgi:Zn-dependent peptidase ImmA (M78 family)
MPSKIRIASHNYKVSETKDLKNDKGEGAWGLSSHSDSVISIDKTLASSHKKTILLHEILHAVVYATGFEFKDDREEEFIRTMTPTLLATLQDNKKITEYLVNVK